MPNVQGNRPVDRRVGRGSRCAVLNHQENEPPQVGHVALPPPTLNSPIWVPQVLHRALAMTVTGGPPAAATNGPPQPGQIAGPPAEA